MDKVLLNLFTSLIFAAFWYFVFLLKLGCCDELLKRAVIFRFAVICFFAESCFSSCGQHGSKPDLCQHWHVDGPRSHHQRQTGECVTKHGRMRWTGLMPTSSCWFVHAPETLKSEWTYWLRSMLQQNIKMCFCFLYIMFCRGRRWGTRLLWCQTNLWLLLKSFRWASKIISLSFRETSLSFFPLFCCCFSLEFPWILKHLVSRFTYFRRIIWALGRLLGVNFTPW